MKTVILDGFAVNPGDLDWEFLASFGEYDVYPQSTPEQVAQRIGDADIVVTNRMRIDGSTLDQCPNLKFVSAFGTGYDMIDVPELRKRGVEVCNIPGYSTVSVAQFAFSLMLAISTRIDLFRGAVRSGTWTGRPEFKYQTIPYSELDGKTIYTSVAASTTKPIVEYLLDKYEITAEIVVEKCGAVCPCPCRRDHR